MDKVLPGEKYLCFVGDSAEKAVNRFLERFGCKPAQVVIQTRGKQIYTFVGPVTGKDKPPQDQQDQLTLF